MPFQFICPVGHVLQAEWQHAGQRSQCPICGSMMIIPNPVAPPDGMTAGDEGGRAGVPRETAPKIVTATPAAGVPAAVQALDAGPQLYHIPCPNGHELETPVDMLGQYVMCPACQAQFQLLVRDSREYQTQRQIEQEAEEARLERSWLNWAIALVILVLLGLAALIGLSLLNR